jgi:RNA polymerase sigma-70 factor (ECF subfamily)
VSPPSGLTEAFRDSQRHLWGLCYRMTGCAADADDLVQETFTRAVTRPPNDTGRPWRPWLVKVAMNLSRDHLRRRRRRGYVGPFLPGAVEPAAYETETTAGRYDLLESVSLAFLLALERLTPQKRAVLILRDVFDYTVAETAEALDMSEANVKTTLHRARRQIADYDRAQQGRLADATERTRRALEALFAGLAARDTSAIESLLADDVRALSDGGGDYLAALNPIVGRAKVMRFFLGLLDKRGMPSRAEMRTLNGQPAVVAEWEVHEGGDATHAPRSAVFVELDEDGRIQLVGTILADRKLHGVRACQD